MLFTRVALRRWRYFKAEREGFAESLSTEIQYGIRAKYRHRFNNAFFDDTLRKDEYQREVYEEASRIAKDISARRVADVGCGSGYKLVLNFPNTPTIGYDLEPTVSFLRATYPDREWLSAAFTDDVEPSDLVICADVIEHIPDPDTLMDFLVKITDRRLVLSTPERRLIYGWDHSGPPKNIAHCREWTQDEFITYVSKWFKVDDARITNKSQATQMVICSHR